MGEKIMGEIKSSIEMAMERTKKLLLSPEEKEKLHREELFNRAKGMVSRYQEGNLSLNDLETEVENHPAETRDFFFRLIFEKMIEDIRIGQDNQRVLDAISLFKKGKIDSHVLEMITAIEEEYEKTLQDGFRSVESLLKKKLEGLGIWGNALIPNVEGSAEWREFKGETVGKFEEELKELKAKI